MLSRPSKSSYSWSQHTCRISWLYTLVTNRFIKTCQSSLNFKISPRSHFVFMTHSCTKQTKRYQPHAFTATDEKPDIKAFIYFLGDDALWDIIVFYIIWKKHAPFCSHMYNFTLSLQSHCALSHLFMHKKKPSPTFSPLQMSHHEMRDSKSFSSGRSFLRHDQHLNLWGISHQTANPGCIKSI